MIAHGNRRPPIWIYVRDLVTGDAAAIIEFTRGPVIARRDLSKRFEKVDLDLYRLDLSELEARERSARRHA